MRGSLLLHLSLVGALGACNDLSAPAGGGGGLPDPVTLRLWRNSNARAYSRPLVVGQAVFFLTAGEHDVTAVNKTTGALLWKTHLVLPDPAFGGFGLAFGGGRLLVGDSELFGLDPVTGAVVWQYVPSSGKHPGYRSLTSDGTIAYCGSGSGGYMYAVDGATGTERWKAKISPDTNVGVFNPVLDRGVVYAGFSDYQVPPGPYQSGRVFGGVSAVDAASGRILWTTLLPHPDSASASTTEGVAVVNGRVFAGSLDGTLYALDAATGAIMQSVPPAQFVFGGPRASGGDLKVFASTGSTLYVGSLFGTISAWSVSDLKRLWIKNIDSHGSVQDLVADADLVYANHVGGQLSVLKGADGATVWMIDAAALRNGFNLIAAAPALDGDRIYLGGFQESYGMKKRP